MLGYSVNKQNKTDADRAAYDNDNHAWRGVPEQQHYIMSRPTSSAVDLSRRRVNPIEYSRLNGGGGLRTNTSVTPVMIVNPNKPITNTIYK